MKYSAGRYVYGLAAIGFGVCALAWGKFDALGSVPHREMLTYVAAAVIILGGAAIEWPRTARGSAAAVGAIYLAFALLGLPLIFQHPLIYNNFGNFFEQFSLFSGAAILYAGWDRRVPARTATVARFGFYSFGICVGSFALEQFFYLPATASLVPKWIPPGQRFWAVATTAAFTLAALALLTGIMARPAARCTTAMVVGFGLLVWLPLLVAEPHSFVNWSEGAETLGIAGSAWVVADFLSDVREEDGAKEEKVQA